MKAPVYVGETPSKHRAGQVLAPPIPAQVGWEAGWGGCMVLEGIRVPFLRAGSLKALILDRETRRAQHARC